MRKHLRTFAVVAAAILMLLLAGCGGKSADSADSPIDNSVIDNSDDYVFEPDLTGTEWLGFRVESTGEYVASAEFVFSQDRVQYLDRDVEYTLHTGEEAYTEAQITEEDGEALYTADSFEGDKRGGFVIIIMHYEDGGRDEMYGWMNSLMDKMELTDPYDGARMYFFRRDSDAALAAYEKKIEPYFDAFLKKYYSRGEDYEVEYSDRTLVISYAMENSGRYLNEEEAKSWPVTGTIKSSFDNDDAGAAELAGELEPIVHIEGIRVKLVYTYKGELIASATYDKSGEIIEERYLYGR